MPLNEILTLVFLATVAVTGLAVAVYLFAGLFQARSLIRREFSAYFLSPIAYVVMVVFLAATGQLFATALELLTAGGPAGTEWPMQTMFSAWWFWLIFLFIPPLLTMRLFAEERASGTLEVLMTAPLRDWQVVLGKYVACLGFYVVLWLPTLVYLPALLGAGRPVYDAAAWDATAVVAAGGGVAALAGLLLLLPRLGTGARAVSAVLVVTGVVGAGLGGWLHYRAAAPHVLEIPVALDPYPVLATYLGMFLAGAMFLSLGLLVSSMVANQLVAALVALSLSLLFLGAGFLRPEQDGSSLYQALYYFSVPLHFDRAFTRGILDTRPVVLYASVTLFCLFVTVRSLESRRWQ